MLRGLRRASLCDHSLVGNVGSNHVGGMDVFSCYYRVLSVRGLCDELITHPEEFYRVWCLRVCCETSIIGGPWPIRGCFAIGGKNIEGEVANLQSPY